MVTCNLDCYLHSKTLSQWSWALIPCSKQKSNSHLSLTPGFIHSSITQQAGLLQTAQVGWATTLLPARGRNHRLYLSSWHYSQKNFHICCLTLVILPPILWLESYMLLSCVRLASQNLERKQDTTQGRRKKIMYCWVSNLFSYSYSWTQITSMARHIYSPHLTSCPSSFLSSPIGQSPLRIFSETKALPCFPRKQSVCLVEETLPQMGS